MYHPTKNHYLIVSDYYSRQRESPAERVTKFDLTIINMETEVTTTLKITDKSKNALYKYFKATQKSLNTKDGYFTRPILWHINDSEAISYLKFLVGDYVLNNNLNFTPRLITDNIVYTQIGRTAECEKYILYHFKKRFEQKDYEAMQVLMTRDTMETLGGFVETIHRFLIGQPNDLINIYRHINENSWEETKDCPLLKTLETVCKKLPNKYPNVSNKHDKDNILYNFYRTILENRSGEYSNCVYGGTPKDFKNKIQIKKLY